MGRLCNFGKLAALTLVSGLGAACMAGELHVPQARLPLMKTSPVIDGEVKPEEWAGAARMERMGGGEGKLFGAEASFWVGCDGVKLYFAMVSETPPGGKLLQRVMPAPADSDNSTVFQDDTFELALDPLRGGSPERRRLYHAIINAKGAIMDYRFVPSGGGEAWRGGWTTASKVIGDRWHFEASLPLKDIGVTPADMDKPFGLRVCRNWKQIAGMSDVYPAQTEWSPLGGAYLSPETMPVVTWDPAAPVVQVERITNPGDRKMDIRLSIANPHARPMELSTLIQAIPRNSAHSERDAKTTLAPGERKTVELTGPALPGEEIYTMIKVASADGKDIYYLRDFKWGLDRPDPFFRANQEAPRSMEVDYAYFPWHDTIKVKVNLTELKEKEKARAVNLTLHRKGGASPLAQTAMLPLKGDKTVMEWKIPRLGEGEYELVVSLDGLKIDPVKLDFVRRVFDWEHNKLGMSDLVVPPFTPMQVEGGQVSAILRRHAMNGVGLWDQVVSLDRPLLKKPMRLDAVIDGKPVEIKTSAFEFAAKSGTKVVAKGNWSAGGLQGAVTSEWDYDGMMKWTLDLEPSPARVDALSLVVPLDDALMPLMHACTDGIRFNYAGKVPDGEGQVWNSAKAARNTIIGSYVPYIWVGAEERGLCVFGENDRGWITAADKPCQTLARERDTLVLTLNLIAKPASIDAPRKIVVGFQATPVKPMPPDWRTWVFANYAAVKQPLTKKIAFVGSCPYWGAELASDDLWPRGRDWGYFDKLAETRRTKVVDTKFIDQWMEGYGKILDANCKTDTQRKDTLQFYRNHVNYAFNEMKGDFDAFDIYTNGRGVRLDTPEGQTFLDEWHRDAFPKRKWSYGGGVSYEMDPVASFRDYALSCYKQMADRVVDSIYWDDLFLAANNDTVGTDAYELPDGTIQPSNGLFNMRELVRRAAIFYTESNKPCLNMVHMTNAALTPVLILRQNELHMGGQGRRSGFPGPVLARLHPRREHRPATRQRPALPLAGKGGKGESGLGGADRRGRGVDARDQAADRMPSPVEDLRHDA